MRVQVLVIDCYYNITSTCFLLSQELVSRVRQLHARYPCRIERSDATKYYVRMLFSVGISPFIFIYITMRK